MHVCVQLEPTTEANNILLLACDKKFIQKIRQCMCIYMHMDTESHRHREAMKKKAHHPGINFS